MSSHDCAGCEAGDAFGAERRAFLRHAAAAAGAALAALGAAPAEALAAPLAFVSPVARRGETRTYPIPATDGGNGAAGQAAAPSGSGAIVIPRKARPATGGDGRGRSRQ